MLYSFSHYVYPARFLIVSLLALVGFVVTGIEDMTASNPAALVSIADTQSSVKTSRERKSITSSSLGGWGSIAGLNTARVSHSATLLPTGVQ